MVRPSLRDALGDCHVRVALVTATALLVQAVIAKNVIKEQLDFVSQNAALLVFVVYMISGDRSRAAEIGTIGAIIVVTAAVLGVYAA